VREDPVERREPGGERRLRSLGKEDRGGMSLGQERPQGGGGGEIEGASDGGHAGSLESGELLYTE
jgi:hypothetical protein